MRYHATIKTEEKSITKGREIPILPNSKKTTFFPSIEAATKKIEIWGRRGIYGQGRVYENGNLIFTIAI